MAGARVTRAGRGTGTRAEGHARTLPRLLLRRGSAAPSRELQPPWLLWGWDVPPAGRDGAGGSPMESFWCDLPTPRETSLTGVMAGGALSHGAGERAAGQPQHPCASQRTWLSVNASLWVKSSVRGRPHQCPSTSGTLLQRRHWERSGCSGCSCQAPASPFKKTPRPGIWGRKARKTWLARTEPWHDLTGGTSVLARGGDTVWHEAAVATQSDTRPEGTPKPPTHHQKSLLRSPLPNFPGPPTRQTDAG